MEVGADVQEPLDDGGVLGDRRHVQHVLAVVLLGQVDVVKEEGEVLEHPLGQVHVDGGAHQEADVEDGLADGPAALDEPAVLCVLLGAILVGVLAHHLGQQVRVLELEAEGLGGALL